MEKEYEYFIKYELDMKIRIDRFPHKMYKFVETDNFVRFQKWIDGEFLVWEQYEKVNIISFGLREIISIKYINSLIFHSDLDMPF